MTQRVVVVTGSSSGLGQAIALAFAQSGDSIVVHGNKNVDGLKATENSIRGLDAECLAIKADIASSIEANRLVEQAFAWKDRVDVWINAAGADVLTGAGKLLSFEGKLEILWRVDVMGTIAISRAAADRMIHQSKGSMLPVIINVSWDQAESGMEGDSGQFFSATKAAVAAFSKSLAKSVAPNVRVNCLAPAGSKPLGDNRRRPNGTNALDVNRFSSVGAASTISLKPHSCSPIPNPNSSTGKLLKSTAVEPMLKI